MLDIKIESWNTIDSHEVATFTYDTRVSRGDLQWERFNYESILQDLEEMRLRKDPCCIARRNEQIVGVMYIWNYTDSMVYIYPWHPVVVIDDNEDEIARLLILKSIEYTKNSGRSRLEIFLMNLVDSRFPQYEVYQKWYESAIMPQAGEWAHMSAQLSKLDLVGVELPEDYFVREIKDVTNDELYPCYYESFIASGDSRFLDQTERERRENFDDMFDRRRPFDKGASIVIVKGDQIVGMNQVLIDGKKGFMHGICIHPNHWRKGLGTAMMRMSMRRALENGLLEMTLEVDIENIKAIKLYEKVGFRKIKGSISHVWKMDS